MFVRHVNQGFDDFTISNDIPSFTLVRDHTCVRDVIANLLVVMLWLDTTKDLEDVQVEELVWVAMVMKMLKAKKQWKVLCLMNQGIWMKTMVILEVLPRFDVNHHPEMIPWTTLTDYQAHTLPYKDDLQDHFHLQDMDRTINNIPVVAGQYLHKIQWQRVLAHSHQDRELQNIIEHPAILNINDIQDNLLVQSPWLYHHMDHIYRHLKVLIRLMLDLPCQVKSHILQQVQVVLQHTWAVDHYQVVAQVMDFPDMEVERHRRIHFQPMRNVFGRLSEPLNNKWEWCVRRLTLCVLMSILWDKHKVSRQSLERKIQHLSNHFQHCREGLFLRIRHVSGKWCNLSSSKRKHYMRWSVLCVWKSIPWDRQKFSCRVLENLNELDMKSSSNYKMKLLANQHVVLPGYLQVFH